MAWTAERVEILTSMWTEGKSASLIAKELGGVTRNAVIGKVHRLGLSNRASGNIEKIKKEGSKEGRVRANRQSREKDSTTRKIIAAKQNIKNDYDNQTSSDNTSGIRDAAPLMRQNKSIVFSANQPLPPQPSTLEVSEETLKNVHSIEKRSKKLSLMELTERTCKWPIGDPATDKFWFCGHTAEPGKPYCDTHIEIAFQPMAAKRDRRIKQ